ncbi:LysE family transporter [Silvimonas sp. JCM 19000]
MNQIWPFLLFSLVASITPGPTNVLVLGQSARYGLRQALPLVVLAGAAAASMIVLVGVGLGEVARWAPLVRTALTWLGALWLSWMAIQLWRAADMQLSTDHASKPVPAWQAAALQLINPKSWVMALTVTSVFGHAGALWQLALLFWLMSLPCMGMWAALGATAQRLLPSARAMGRFNRSMAVLLLASTWLAIL